MAMFNVYFDQSTGDGSPLLVVAGFLSDDAHWSQFEGDLRYNNKLVLRPCRHNYLLASSFFSASIARGNSRSFSRCT